MSETFWTEPRLRALRTLWAAGRCTRTIAESIGDSCTRNMVIGKAHRLGLPARSKQEWAKAMRDGWAVFLRSPEGKDWTRQCGKTMERLWRNAEFRRKVRAGKGFAA